ncbi:MAG: hypothetical protein H0T65_11315, partial [Deltaproteobacteria bacterium]|nr:hypothetical protein [Deltaproteobacteria bacterium]
SKFELAKLPGKLAASVCEPASVRFVVPAGGKSVRIRIDKPALVQVQTPIAIAPPADRLEPPYDSVVLIAMKWRYARFVDRGWLALRPRSIAPDRVALLASQARLETKEVPPVSEARASSLDMGGGGRQTIIERVPAEDAAEFIAKWDVGHYTRLVPDKAIKLDMGRLPTRPTIRYRADDSVGASAKVVVDGVTTDDRLNAARGSLKLESNLTGTHELRVDTDARVQLLVDRPPTGTSAELYALRTISPLDGTGRVKVNKRSAAKQNINILMYTPSASSATTVRVMIDGGSPARISGAPLATWTLADRTVPLPPSDRPATLGFADTAGGKLYPRRVVVALGDDLPPGAHTIELSVIGGERVWTRLFTLDDAPVAARARQWRESVEEAP